jgi:hypothetical protein
MAGVGGVEAMAAANVGTASQISCVRVGESAWSSSMLTFLRMVMLVLEN